MATVTDGADLTASSLQAGTTPMSEARFAWATVALAAWLTLGVLLVSWALETGAATDAGFSAFHVPGYLALVALAAWCAILVAREVRAGRSWRTAFPTGYGVLGAGLLTLMAYVIVDLGWREGVGIAPGLEGSLAPSRILLVIGMALVAIGPLRAALLTGRHVGAGWPAVLSAALGLGVVWLTGGFHPAVNPWQASSPPSPLDDTEIWVMASDGSRQMRLLEAVDGVELSGATWSPDGRRIAFTRWQLPADGPHEADIWIADADGSHARPLVGGPGWQWIPHWSPDGAWIVYTAESPGGPGMVAGPEAPAAGQGPLGPAFDLAPTVGRAYADVWRIASDGSGEPQRLTDAPGDDRAASYSPDGGTLVFDSTRDGDTELYLMDADGSDQRRLTFDAGEDWGQSWSPDGALIAFNSSRTGNPQIWVVSPDGGDPVRVTESDSADVTPIWAPDGSRIAFTRRGTDEEVWSVAPDGSALRDLSRSPASDESVWDGAWAADGRILFTRSGFGPVTEDPLVQQHLAVASMLLVAIVGALMAALLGAVRPPFGAFGTLLGVATLLATPVSGDARLVPVAIVGGLAIDVVLRLVGSRRQVPIAAAGACLVVTAGTAVTLSLTSGLAWSTTLAVGVVVASIAIGWAVGAVVSTSQRPRDVEPAT